LISSVVIPYAYHFDLDLAIGFLLNFIEPVFGGRFAAFKDGVFFPFSSL